MKKIILYFILLLLIACSKEEELIFGEMMKNAPDQIIQNMHIIEYKDKLLVSETYAKSMRQYEKEKKMKGDSLHIIGYNEDGSWKYTVLGEKGIVNEKANTIDLEGNVIVRSENGILETEFLTWFRSTNNVVIPREVKLTRNNHTIIGENMRTNINFDFVDMEKVRAEGKINEKNFTE